MRYIPHTQADRQAMLDEIGVSSVERLFDDIPARVTDRFRPLELAPKSEMEVARALEGLASLNAAPREPVSFLGGGIYDHYVPSVVSHLTSRSEFYTAYTPYQPEISQGTLTAMFEFQTLVCELTGMEVANASLYDGATALAEAALMAVRVVGRPRIAVARSLFGHFRRVVDTYAWAAGIEVVEVPYTSAGRLDRSAIPEGVAGLLVQSPNAFGVIEDLGGLKEALGEGLLVVAVHPLSLGVLTPPGELGPTSWSARDSRSGFLPRSADPSWASSPAASATCARCPAGSPAGRSTSTGPWATPWPSRRGSSTSAESEPPRTSARTPLSAPSRRPCTSRRWGRRACASSRSST